MRAADAAADRARELSDLSDLLVAAVREAGALALTTFRAPLRSWHKDNASPVSEADIACDRLLRERLGAAGTGIAWLSEESHDDRTRLAARRVWIVDPIDGTRAYLAGLDDWTVSAALVEDGRPVLAALYAPVGDHLYVAIAGSGATLDGVAIAASAGHGLAGARVAGPKPQIERLARLAPQIVAQPKVHSLALRIARVAAGTLEVAFASGFGHDWDLAAADLLVHEAGGALTGFEGRPLAYNRADPVHGPLVAAGRARHEALVALVRSQSGESA